MWVHRRAWALSEGCFQRVHWCSTVLMSCVWKQREGGNAWYWIYLLLQLARQESVKSGFSVFVFWHTRAAAAVCVSVCSVWRSVCGGEGCVVTHIRQATNCLSQQAPLTRRMWVWLIFWRCGYLLGVSESECKSMRRRERERAKRERDSVRAISKVTRDITSDQESRY